MCAQSSTHSDQANGAWPLSSALYVKMNKHNKKIDEYINKERNKKFRVYSVLLFLFVLALIIINAYTSGSIIKVEGIVNNVHSQASEEIGQHFYIIVKLEDASIIKLSIPRSTIVKKGDKVLLNKRETNLFNFTNYSFNRVTNDKDV